MRKKIYVVVISLLTSVVSYAQIYESVHARGGNVYEGYISRQDPGKTITVATVRTTYSIPSSEVVLVKKEKEPIANLPDMLADLFKGINDTVKVNIARIETKDKVFSRAYLIEDGVKYRFVCAKSESVVLKWSDVELIKKVHDGFESKCGVNDVLVDAFSAERIEGKVVEQDIRNAVLKFKFLSGEIKSYKTSDIMTLAVEPIDKSKSIFVQIPLLDRVVLNDGNSYEGCIISRRLGKSLAIRTVNSEELVKLNNQDIRYYEKYINSFYIPVVEEKQDDSSLNEADLTVNGKKADFAKIHDQKNGEYVVAVPTDSIKTVMKVGESVEIAMKVSSRTSRVRVVQANLQKEKNFSIKGLKIKRKGVDFWPSFTDSDIAKDADVNFQKNDGKKITMDIIFSSPGTYMVYAEGQLDKCVPVVVKDK